VPLQTDPGIPAGVACISKGKKQSKLYTGMVILLPEVDYTNKRT